MAEYIERKTAMLTPALPKKYRRYQTDNLDDAYEQGWNDALDNLKNAPVADVAPTVHGRWITENGKDICSRCQITALEPDAHLRFYWCPNCGAKMDEG